MSLQVKGRIDARNSLETYCYNMKSTIEDKLGDKVSDEQKETVCSFSLDTNLLAACHLLTGFVLPKSMCWSWVIAACQGLLQCPKRFWNLLLRLCWHEHSLCMLSALQFIQALRAHMTYMLCRSRLLWMRLSSGWTTIKTLKKTYYREKLKEVEDTCSPIVSSAYQAGGGPGGADEDLDDHDEL